MKPAMRVILVIVFVAAAIAWYVQSPPPATAPVDADAVAVMTKDSGAAVSDAAVVETPAVDTTPVVFNYDCAGTAAEFTAQGEDAGVLDVAGEVYHLSRSIAASGVKYETASGIEPRALFWTKGEEALLEVSGKDDRTCTQNKQAPLPAAANGAIEGVEWQVVELDHRPLSNAKVTMTLDGAGRISGSSGCNRYSGPYTIDVEARSLNITGPVVGTRMACVAPEAMAAENTFNALLEKITAYKIEDGGVLVIYAGNDDVLRLAPASAQ